jgi:Ca-activated chloride channel family protein
MSESSQAEGILFQQNGKAVPLKGVEIHGDIIGRGAKVKISQRFLNTEKKPIEAVYKFPLPENAAVCGFSALIDGRIIEGKIEEKEKAFELYDKALADGDKAQLMDEERPNIFTLSVGNIKPDSSIIIEITYVTILDSHNSEVRFYLPTTISPRFTPASQKDDNGIPVGDIVNPPFVFQVPYGLKININVHDRKAISSIESPSHTINTGFNGDDATITFSSDKVAMDRDFVLTIAYEKDFTNRAFLFKENDEIFIQVDLTPDKISEPDKTDNMPQGREIVFVLDCSGSMQGESIEEAKKALEILIKALSTDMMFNIYRFGNEFVHLYRHSKSYNEKSMKDALQYLSKTDASLGGTEVLPPLADIYEKEPVDGYRRDVILITDGEISNEDEVMELVQHHNHTTTLSTIGIGSGPNEFLIKGVARAAGGSSELIATQERIEPKVLRLFQKVMAGRITNLKIECGAEIDQTPAYPIAYMRQGTSIFAKVKDGNFQSKSVGIKQYNREGSILREWNIDLEEVNNQEMPVSKLWAREKIQEIEEGSGSLEGSRQRQRSDSRKHMDVVDISLKYGIISRSTSFFGIEKKSDAEETTSNMALRFVPTYVTDGWHGTRSAPKFSRRSQAQYSIRQVQESHVSEQVADAMPAFLRRQSSDTVLSMPFSLAAQGIRNVLSHIRKRDPLMDILSLQRVGGGFDIDRAVGDLLQISHSRLQSFADDMSVKNHPDRIGILATAIVLAILELKFGARRDEWDGVVSKSRSWLQDQIAEVSPTIDQEPLEDWVRKFVKDRLKAS